MDKKKILFYAGAIVSIYAVVIIHITMLNLEDGFSIFQHLVFAFALSVFATLFIGLLAWGIYLTWSDANDR